MKCPAFDKLPPPPAGKSNWPWIEDFPSETDPTTASTGDKDKPDWPRITIVTPSYNQGSFLEETIRSVLLQNYPNLEYFVVDGGSTDNSVEIIRKYENYLTWWVSEKDKGQSHAINKAFARATGTIHAYINSDDFFEPGALRSVAMAFGGGRRWVVGQVQCLQDGIRIGAVPQLAGSRFTDWFVTCPVSQVGSFWTAELHHEVGQFREDLHYFFDYEFWLRFRFIAKVKPRIIDQTVANYRLHPQSKTMMEGSAFAFEAKIIREHYRHLLSSWQLGWLWVVQRHRKARMHGSRSITLMREGKFMEAAKHLKIAFMTWPLLVVDRGIILAIKQLTRKKDDKPHFPNLGGGSGD